MQLFKILISLGFVANAVAEDKIKISQSNSRAAFQLYIAKLGWCSASR